MLLGAAAGALALRLTTKSPRSSNSASGVTARLERAGKKLALIYGREGYSSPHALATRLAVSNPSTEYAGYYALGANPPLGVIGVFSAEHEFRLRGRTKGGKVLELVGVERGSRYRLVGPRLLRNGLVANGGFEDPLGPPWIISTRKGEHVKLTTDALAGAYSLSLRYTRPDASQPSSITQIVRRLPAHARGTQFTMREIVRTRELSRPVICGLQLLYRDGTSRYLGGTTGSQAAKSNALATGILAGSQDFATIVASGIATKPVSGVRIFAVYAGSQALLGAISVDDVELAVRRTAAR